MLKNSHYKFIKKDYSLNNYKNENNSFKVERKYSQLLNKILNSNKLYNDKIKKIREEKKDNKKTPEKKVENKKIFNKFTTNEKMKITKHNNEIKNINKYKKNLYLKKIK